MQIITISGKAESGKDTTAAILKTELEALGYSVLIAHYADLLKYICKQFFGWNGEKDKEGRTLLQIVGTEGIRSKEPDYWVDFIKQILGFFPNEWDFVLIPDTRFPNEIDGMKATFQTVSVKIVRPNYENSLTEEQRNHKSETALDDYVFDYTITNPGDISGLNTQIKQFIQRLSTDNEKKSLMDMIKEKL